MGFKVISVQQATGSTGYSYGTVLNYSKVRYLGIWVYILIKSRYTFLSTFLNTFADFVVNSNGFVNY